jgi:glutamine amidotransferase
MIAVIDYNVGNVRSVCKALTHIGCDCQLTSDKKTIQNAAGIILPGVAAFGYAMAQLGKTADLIREMVDKQMPLLGICVGHQLLFEKSYEHGEHDGLGLVGGDVLRLPENVVIPHMGWNKVQGCENMRLFAGFETEKHFYFAHSYWADVDDSRVKIACCDYGFEVTSTVEKANVFGVQFHPEKSGPQGLKLLQNFVDIAHSWRESQC